MNKQINLIINGKGGVGKASSPRTSFSISKIAASLIARSTATTRAPFLTASSKWPRPDVAKTLNFLRSGFGAARLLSSKVQRLCFPFPEMQPSRVAFPAPHLRKLRRALHSDNA
jgi:hypothetical protein